MPEGTLGVAPGAAPNIESRVTVYRHGELEFPIDILLETDSGEQIREHWDGTGRFTTLSHVGPSPVAWALADPEGNIALDENRLNNAVGSKPRAPLRALDSSLYALQLLLGLASP
jgi:hypothetical protein